MLYTDFILRICLSLVLGFLIGLERQLTGHQAGIRINILICIGTSFFTLFPMIYGSDQVFRVGSSIISGIGFLCSGVIFKDSGAVRGMNTAATLWCTAAVGILASTGMYEIAITAAAVLIGSNLLLRPLAKKLNPLVSGDESEKQYRISITCQEKVEWEIRQLLINSNSCKTLFLSNLESGDVVGNKVEIIAEYCSSGKLKNNILEGIVGQALEIPEVISAGWEVL
ncbi:MgtC/SapB family protein [Phascolarctobacterium faecium]|uniref:MgtC/SapB family protein n=1 Tax=Phascolarctobacterium faecium TaxID=33025 RepID=UPI003078186D